MQNRYFKFTKTCIRLQMIPYTLVRSLRTTIQISVLPDRTIEVRAPLFAPKQKIDEIVSNREKWIQKKLATHTMAVILPVHHTYSAGETIRYLGKPYILRISTESAPGRSIKNTVFIEERYLFVRTRSSDERSIRHAVETWQKQQAQVVFTGIFAACWKCFSAQYPNVPKPEMRLRTMKTRWGSMTQSHSRTSTPRMTLNTLLICTEPTCILPVVYHELCHLIHPDHSRAFYETLRFFVPDCKETKKILEETYRLS